MVASQGYSSPKSRRSSLERVEEDQILDTSLETLGTPLAIQVAAFRRDASELEQYFVCDYGCRFSAPFEIVAEHEKICTWRHQKPPQNGSLPGHMNELNGMAADSSANVNAQFKASADGPAGPYANPTTTASGQDNNDARKRFEIDINMVASPQDQRGRQAIVTTHTPPTSPATSCAVPNSFDRMGNGGAECSRASEMRLAETWDRESDPARNQRAELRLQVMRAEEIMDLERQNLVQMTARIRQREEDAEKLRRELDESRKVQEELKSE
eukprot:3831354-Rhodomonas_salina.1